MRVISEGFVFGETNFALGTTSRTYHARASVDSAVVLEISGPSVMRMLDGDAEMRARLYFVLCQVRFWAGNSFDCRGTTKTQITVPAHRFLELYEH